ncbi:hypothetical protein [Kitasatospora sp. KL5]
MTGSNPAAADSAWTLRGVDAAEAPAVAASQVASATLLLDDSAWT